MITATNLTVAFGGFTLLDNISLHVGDNEKIGLVGKNGAGKSTLLKVILGTQSPTSGSVLTTKGERLGYLPQQMEHAKERCVIEETLKAFDWFYELQERIETINSELVKRSDYSSPSYASLIVELNNLNEQVALFGSAPPLSQAERVLVGLGFKREDFERPTKELSQGWNMRIELAKVLLSAPDALLLDEPTNHLDIESIQWFEDYLKSFKGSVILISHDRRFLDSITSRTVEIMLGKLYDYKVPYTKYKELRAERMAQQRAAYENQRRMIEKTEEFIERFRYKATKSNQVQSRIKQLDKLERIEIDQDDTSSISVKFPPSPRSGSVVFRASDLKLGYKNNVRGASGGVDNKSKKGGSQDAVEEYNIVVRSANLVIERGEKVAFVGRNGEGKTTMMRVITGELTPLEGEAQRGYNVNIGYYAQNQEDILDKTDTVFGTLDKIAVGDVRTKLRDILAAFLFRGEDIDKKVSVLSGGERARLAMASLMLSPHNLLALDEPTNHMDILSKEVLKKALLSYDGTLIIVSHDRDFLNGLVGKVYEFRDGGVKEHLGGIEQYLEHLKESDHNTTFNRKGQFSDNSRSTSAKGEEKKESESSSRRSRAESKLLRRKRGEIERCEAEITRLEALLSEVEGSLSTATSNDEIITLSNRYTEIKKSRDDKVDEWFRLSES